MAALHRRCGHYVFILWFLLSSLPNLGRHRLDVYHTATHSVALVWIYNAGLKCAACGSLKIQDAKNAKNSPSWPHHTTLSSCIFPTKACIDNRKKNLLNSNTSCTCPRPHSMVNFGLLTAEIGSGVWGTPANFNRFRVLVALLHGSRIVGVSQSLRCWTEGRHLHSAGRPSHWALAHILVVYVWLVLIAYSVRMSVCEMCHWAWLYRLLCFTR